MGGNQKKVAIITLYTGSTNYGALLQAFALQKVIEKMGYDCQQMKVTGEEASSNLIGTTKWYFQEKGFFGAIKFLVDYALFGILLRKIYFLKYRTDVRKRKEVLRSFREEIIKHSDKAYSLRNIEEADQAYDIFVCGSDQVWNPNIARDMTPVYWLDFVSKGKKKFAYAASAGLDGFPKEEYPRIRNSLKDYSGISVREKALQKNLRSFLPEDQKIELVADPSLLLPPSDWEACLGERYLEGDYIFTYFLEATTAQKSFVRRFGKKMGLRVVALPYYHGLQGFDRGLGDIRLFDVSPLEWVNLVKYARFVFTDSFHCGAFAGIFHRHFYLFKRFADGDAQSMNSRIYSLMELFGTPHRIIEERESIFSLKKVGKIDFAQLDENVERLRKSSMEFLKGALES